MILNNNEEITTEELELLAKNTSNELYKKYKDINECNWKDFI